VRKERTLPEITGTVTAKSDNGIILDDSGVWWNWTNIEWRKEPFNLNVNLGDVVDVVYREKKYEDGKKAVFITSIDKVSSARDVTPDGDVPFEYAWEGTEAEEARPGTRQVSGKVWGYEQRDRLMARESCCKAAASIFAASIGAGLLKTHPGPGEVIAFAAALESWVMEALGGATLD